MFKINFIFKFNKLIWKFFLLNRLIVVKNQYKPFSILKIAPCIILNIKFYLFLQDIKTTNDKYIIKVNQLRFRMMVILECLEVSWKKKEYKNIVISK